MGDKVSGHPVWQSLLPFGHVMVYRPWDEWTVGIAPEGADQWATTAMITAYTNNRPVEKEPPIVEQVATIEALLDLRHVPAIPAARLNALHQQRENLLNRNLPKPQLAYGSAERIPKSLRRFPKPPPQVRRLAERLADEGTPFVEADELDGTLPYWTTTTTAGHQLILHRPVNQWTLGIAPPGAAHYATRAMIKAYESGGDVGAERSIGQQVETIEELLDQGDLKAIPPERLAELNQQRTDLIEAARTAEWKAGIAFVAVVTGIILILGFTSVIPAPMFITFLLAMITRIALIPLQRWGQRRRERKQKARAEAEAAAEETPELGSEASE